MARPKKQLSRAEFGLNQNLIGQIEDLQEAFLGAPQHRVVAFALEWYFTSGVDAEPELKRRYEDAQKARMAAKTR
jgi:hypothetical protein